MLLTTSSSQVHLLLFFVYYRQNQNKNKMEPSLRIFWLLGQRFKLHPNLPRTLAYHQYNYIPDQLKKKQNWINQISLLTIDKRSNSPNNRAISCTDAPLHSSSSANQNIPFFVRHVLLYPFIPHLPLSVLIRVKCLARKWASKSSTAARL